MYIQYFGHSCFKLTGKDSKGENVALVLDPFSKDCGLKVPHLEADVLAISHSHRDHNNIDAVKGNPYVIDTAGEYDVKDIFIQGFDSFHDDKEGKERGGNIIYRISIEDVVITHLGDLGQVLNTKQLESLEGTDILLIPVGGKYTLDAKKAVEVINQIEPRMVIPMHYKTAEAKFDISGVESFIKEIGMKPNYIEDKFRVNKKDLPQEDMELTVFK
jgi:L-ascorbate metabolism protein UlaG (beta-lactamase superfamily)